MVVEGASYTLLKYGMDLLRNGRDTALRTIGTFRFNSKIR